MGTATEGKGSRKGQGEWGEANRHRQLQTAIHANVIPPPPSRHCCAWGSVSQLRFPKGGAFCVLLRNDHIRPQVFTIS